MVKSKVILVHGAGGAPALNYIRSLKLGKDKFKFIGIDCDKFNILRSEAGKNYLMPQASDSLYKDLYFEILKNENVDFVHSQIDQEIPFLSKNRDKIPLFLPSAEAIRISQNKMESYDVWKNAGIKVPLTILLKDERDLKTAFRNIGPTLWIREIFGSAGRNSLPTNNFLLAKAWINRYNGWGKFTAAECLLPETITWMSIWKDGELIIAQTRKRLYWESGNRSPSGVTGITGTGVTYSDEIVNEIAIQAIKAIEKKPNGIHSIDMTYDKNGIPNPTENNIGRFFTTHLFFAKAGCNFAYLYTKLGLNEKIRPVNKKINPLPDGLAWIRGMDMEPVLTKIEATTVFEKELENRKRKILHEK